MKREHILKWLTARMPAKGIDLHGKHYIERYHVLTLGKLTLLLHRYFSADGDRHQHDHPHRWSLGIPLIGGYTEERLQALCPNRGAITKLVHIRPWRWNYISWNRFHRIASVRPGSWTLFITYNRRKFWGELRPDERKPSQLTYRPVPDTSPTPRSWYKTAKTGRELRWARGTE